MLAAYQGDLVGALGPFWSLAVEEQFYLVWPLVILLVPMSRLPSLMLTLIAGSVALRGLIYAFWTPHGDVAAYVLTVSRFDALGIGGFLAVRTLSVRTLSFSGIAIVACGAVLPSALSAALTEFGLGLACAALVLAVANGWASRVWSAWPLVAVGTISYGVYVWQCLADTIILWIGQTFDVWTRWDNTFGWWHFTYLSAVALGLASLSWFLIEKPINRLKRFAPYVPRPEPTIVSEFGGGTALGSASPPASRAGGAWINQRMQQMSCNRTDVTTTPPGKRFDASYLAALYAAGPRSRGVRQSTRC